MSVWRGGRIELSATHLTSRDAPASFRLLGLAPWLQLLGGLLAFLLISLFTAVQSELGWLISPGESPHFHWIRTHMAELLGVGLASLLFVAGLQYLGFRIARKGYSRWMGLLAGAELVAMGMLAVALLQRQEALLPWGHALLQVSMLIQVLTVLSRSGAPGPEQAVQLLDLRCRRPALFLLSLFLLAALPAYLDPAWHRLGTYVELDSGFEMVLSRMLPAALSGATALWFGIGTLAILAGSRLIWVRLKVPSRLRPGLSCLPFFVLSGLYVAICLVSLAHALEWEISTLRLKGAMLPLFVLLCGGGGVLSAVAFRRVVPHAPRPGGQDLTGMMALSMGAVLVFPLTWFLTRPWRGRRAWGLILAASLLGSLLMAYYILYGDLFNPWFTVFSYLKVAVLKIVAVVAAGIVVLILDARSSGGSRGASRAWWGWMVVAAVVPAGLLPFGFLERYRETKAAILQFNELSMVDATYARLAGRLGVGRWIRLGQAPAPNTHPDPWPLPWTLERTGPSLLPRDFNLLVIVVDALRGDAFRSAGYHRELTPFLDRWGSEEAVVFRRAYSQGGGTFAAFPFLVAGRSRFTLYGPDLYRENLYLKLAQAEGIQQVMLVKGFGPRAIFPPDFPVIELGGAGPGSRYRSVPADEVFGWAREAIARLAKGERFLAFLHLMDVHNDLWKKEDGIDFGDSPRDLYDNNLSYVDRAFGRFVAWLKQRGIYSRTVIVLTSDHGEQFWEHGASLHGHTLYEEEIRIPLILLIHRIRGRVVDVPVVTADIVPTLMELAGYAVKPPYDDPHMGISLVPLLFGQERDRYIHRDVVGRASFKRRYFFYRDWEWKLVYSAEFDLLQLFNPVKDPAERRNFLQEQPELAAELERELLGYLERVEGRSYRSLLAAVRAREGP